MTVSLVNRSNFIKRYTYCQCPRYMFAISLILGVTCLFTTFTRSLRHFIYQPRNMTSGKSNRSLLKREMIPLSVTPPSGSNIRIFQWNILAQALSQNNFVACPEEAVAIEVRKPSIIKEITSHNPDIVCLQEVDMYQFLDSVLSPLGYIGHFYPKMESPCLRFENNIGPDGCAIFHKADRLNLLASVDLNLHVDDKITNQVAILSTFAVRGASGDGAVKFSVLATHLKAKEDMHAMRLKQGEFILNELKERVGDSHLIVMCGDFNANATEPVYDLIKSSDLNFTSAYGKLHPEDAEPDYTTWKIRDVGAQRVVKKHTIDFIWLRKQFGTVTSLLSIPTEAEVGENGIPSWSYPSDHFALACDIVVHS